MLPLQPLYKDEKGFIRFKSNKIVRYLLDNGPYDLNYIAGVDFSNEDREQFAQLIGYSLFGFSELSYVSDETYEVASKVAETGCDEKDGRIEYLEECLSHIRKGVKDFIPWLFKIHPDDLQT
jgi:hypothetical protein